MNGATSGAAADGRFPAPWRAAEWLVLVAGWAGAVACRLPAASDSGPARSALGAALLFWPLAIWVVRSDLLHFLIPDGASAAIATLGLAAAAGGPWLAGAGAEEVTSVAFEAAGVGAVSFAVFWAVSSTFRALGRDALGFGDVKLAGACAIWLPPADAALALELAALGALAALLTGRRKGPLRDTAVPFGAFLAPAAWIVFVLAPPLRDAGVLPW